MIGSGCVNNVEIEGKITFTEVGIFEDVNFLESFIFFKRFRGRSSFYFASSTGFLDDSLA